MLRGTEVQGTPAQHRDLHGFDGTVVMQKKHPMVTFNHNLFLDSSHATPDFFPRFGSSSYAKPGPGRPGNGCRPHACRPGRVGCTRHPRGRNRDRGLLFLRPGGTRPSLESSRVQEHSPTTLKLTQTGVAKYGVFSSHFESIREITLVPQREIQALGVGGTVPHAESRMQLLAEGSGTRMVYHAKVQPGGLFPPFIGPDLVRHQTAQQFSAMVQEMQRRAAAAP